jgi:hypothetical protein
VSRKKHSGARLHHPAELPQNGGQLGPSQMDEGVERQQAADGRARQRKRTHIRDHHSIKASGRPAGHLATQVQAEEITAPPSDVGAHLAGPAAHIDHRIAHLGTEGVQQLTISGLAVEFIQERSLVTLGHLVVAADQVVRIHQRPRF